MVGCGLLALDLDPWAVGAGRLWFVLALPPALPPIKRERVLRKSSATERALIPRAVLANPSSPPPA